MSDIIELNVGGRHYTTYQSTLEKYPDKFLAALVSDRWETKDKDGRYFIDRDGDMFAHVLNFLRTGNVSNVVLDNKLVNFEDFREEMSYYGFTCDYRTIDVMCDYDSINIGNAKKTLQIRKKKRREWYGRKRGRYYVGFGVGIFTHMSDSEIERIIDGYNEYNFCNNNSYYLCSTTDPQEYSSSSIMYQTETYMKFI